MGKNDLWLNPGRKITKKSSDYSLMQHYGYLDSAPLLNGQDR